MKIAIFHNLRSGGGLKYIHEIVNELSKRSIIVDVYTHQNTVIPKTNRTYFYPLKDVSNIFSGLNQVISKTKEIENGMSSKIKRGKYDYIFVFPCHLQQCPNIVNFLPKHITYYFYLESIREFYEKTSFNYFNIKKIISRIIRYPIKLQDYHNCSSVLNIISDSYYSNYQLKRIYNKNSEIIYPGAKSHKPRMISRINNHKSLSFGLLSMLKGHHISAKINPNINIYGSKSHEDISKHISNEVKIYNDTINDTMKSNLYKNHTFYFANQINEPYGLITLEAATNNCFIIGRNEGGTPEIINNGNNGLLYNVDNLILAKKIFKRVQSKDKLAINKLMEISWKETVDKIFHILKYA